MKLKYWFFTLILIGVILVVEYDIAQRTQARVDASLGQPTANQLTVNPASSVTVSGATGEPSLAEPIAEAIIESASFEARFNAEAQAMSQLQTDPNLIEKRLDDLALSLTNNDIDSLKKIMSDTERSGDDRALAIEVLSRRKTPQSLAVLESFVKNHQATTKQNWSRPQEFNSVITAQAIEGIAAYPEKDKALTALDALAKSVDESFLLDRIARSKANLSGNTDSAQQQDEAGLQKLLE